MLNFWVNFPAPATSRDASTNGMRYGRDDCGQLAAHKRAVSRPPRDRQWLLRLALITLAAVGLHAQDPAEIVHRSLDRDWTDFESRKNYTYLETSEFRSVDAKGKTKRERSETNEVMILAGRPYERVVARNGSPLSGKDTSKEQRKLDQELSKRLREGESGRSKYDKERAEDRKYLRQIPEAYNFRLIGQEDVSGQPAWVIDAEPKPGYRPPDSRSKILTKLRAKIWIEQATYHWVKVDAQALDTLSFGLGLVRVAPGGTLHFEQVRVNDEIWLPSSILIRADARLVLLKKLHAEIDIAYRDYKKFQSNSRIVETGGNE